MKLPRSGSSREQMLFNNPFHAGRGVGRVGKTNFNNEYEMDVSNWIQIEAEARMREGMIAVTAYETPNASFT